MQRLNNQFVVKFYETQTYGNYHYHILEYCNSGDLYSELLKRKSSRQYFPEDVNYTIRNRI